mgnify:CR=1 FL=1
MIWALSLEMNYLYIRVPVLMGVGLEYGVGQKAGIHHI